MGRKSGISAIVLVGEEQDRIVGFLDNVSPWFDEFIVVFDTEHADDSESILLGYLRRKATQDPAFDQNRFKIFNRPLEGDFAEQTNYAIDRSSHDWAMRLDVDEVFPTQLLASLMGLTRIVEDLHPEVSVIGFPRLNTLDGKVVNDIPWEHWLSAEFDDYPENPPTISNKDIQYRLHKRHVRWVRALHERVEVVHNGRFDKTVAYCETYIEHHKSRHRQRSQFRSVP